MPIRLVLLALMPLVALPACTADARYQRITNRVDAPGAQLAVLAPDGERWFGAGGDAAEGEPMTTDHQLLIGSNTKVWTAALTLQLVDEGSLSLDDPASTWVGDLDGAITVRDLLQHTSGLGEYFEHDDMIGHTDQAWTPEELIALGSDVRADGPGASVYANTNYIVLGRIIEGVEQRAYPDVLKGRLLDPLELDDSGFIVDPDSMPATLALGDGGALGGVTPEHPSVGWAAGAGYATADDLATFYQALFAGELYSDDVLAAQLDDVPADLGFDDDSLTTGYGLGLMTVGIGDQHVTGHLGSVTGFNALAARDDETGALAVVLTNSTAVVSVRPTLKALRAAGR